MSKKIENHMENEFLQIYESYHHIENMRLHYLQYFITISLALYTAIGYLLLNNDHHFVFILFDIIFLLYSFFSMYIYRAIARLTNSLSALDAFLEKIREKITGNEKLLNLRAYLPKDDKIDKILSLRKLSERMILYIVLFGFFVLLLIDLLSSVFDDLFSKITIIIMVAKIFEIIIIFDIVMIMLKLKNIRNENGT